MYWWRSKHFKDIVGVNVDDSVGWGIGKCVGVGVCRTSGDEVYSDAGNGFGEGVIQLVKELKYKLGVKLILVIKKVGDDIGSGYVVSVSKCIKGGVGVIFGGNVGWYVVRNVDDSVDIYVVSEVGGGYVGGYKLKVEYEVYSYKDSSVSKYVKMELTWKFMEVYDYMMKDMLLSKLI